jgi:molybdopterin converting factor subunit 1
LYESAAPYNLRVVVVEQATGLDMKIRVRAFAAYRELLGCEEMTLDVSSGATPRSVFRQLLGDQPHAERMERTTLFAVNRDYVDPEATLQDGDELSLLPPVAGG